MKVVIAGFGEFLEFKHNTSKEILKNIKARKDLIKLILPVGYFKNDFIAPIVKYSPEIYLILGMWNGDYCKIETLAKNEMLTLKNPLLRCIVNLYSNLLKLKGKNLLIKKPISQDKLTIIKIDKDSQGSIRLHDKPPKISGIKKSEDAENFVCNYAMWVIEKYIRMHRAKTRFYFLHLPQKMTKKQELSVYDFIESIYRNKLN